MASTTGGTDWRQLGERLNAALRPLAPPIAIRFHFDDKAEAPHFDRAFPPANSAGRTGAVPAGCVFWIEAVRRTFFTVASDHANCNVGSFTHGFLDIAAAAKGDDVTAALAAGWIDEAAFAALPVVGKKPTAVTYGPLSEASRADAVLLRVNGVGLMMLKDAFPELAIEGKPQCHVIPLALRTGAPAASVGCALSRARTGMKAEELVCVLPGARLLELVEMLEAAVSLDRAMARYAGQDAQRFA